MVQVEDMVMIGRDQRDKALPVKAPASPEVISAILRDAQFGELRGRNEWNRGQQDA